jgi:hypothetical protein
MVEIQEGGLLFKVTGEIEIRLMDNNNGLALISYLKGQSPE